MMEYLFCCPDCDHDLTFFGTRMDAYAWCPCCEAEKHVCPDELSTSMNEERILDARRDS